MSAHTPSAAYRTRKYIRRHRLGVAVATGVLAILPAFAVVQRVQLQRTRLERDRANRERDRATLPFGNQTVFSRVSTVPAGNGASHGRNFQTSQQTTGTADIARDNGFSTWVDVSPNPYVDAELGYTRSIHYDLNSVSFSLGLNVGRLVRRSAQQ